MKAGVNPYCTQNHTVVSPHQYEGGGEEAPWSPQKWPQNLRICRITSRPRKTGLPASMTSPSPPPFCLQREGVQSSSNSNHRHPNLFCGKRAHQSVTSTNTKIFSHSYVQLNCTYTLCKTEQKIIFLQFSFPFVEFIFFMLFTTFHSA